MPGQSGRPGRRRGSSGRGFATPAGAEPPLIVVKDEPYNAEAPLFALREPRTPTRHFYVRNHFAMAAPDAAGWRLWVEGSVEQPFSIALEELQALPARTLTVTLECAGNDRIGLAPLPKGEPWASGAVSTAIWRGAPLRDLLERAGLRSTAVEVLCEGEDRGTPEGSEEVVPFARSLPLDKARDPDTLLAYELNGEPLPREHGGPVRLLVPGWYGMASVKWLTRIAALERPFAGYYQAGAYVLERPGRDDKEPLSTMRVKSLITSPAPGAALPLEPLTISGLAWSGQGRISRIEVSTEGEGEWQPARLTGEATPYAWQQWEFTWEPSRPGRHALRVRATDERGNTQPDVPEWNRLGYANNAVQLVLVEIRG